MAAANLDSAQLMALSRSLTEESVYPGHAAARQIKWENTAKVCDTHTHATLSPTCSHIGSALVTACVAGHTLQTALRTVDSNVPPGVSFNFRGV